jgi:hypothetical protein
VVVVEEKILPYRQPEEAVVVVAVEISMKSLFLPLF